MLMVPSILMSECAVRKGLLVAAAVAIAGVSFWFLRRPPGAPAKPAAASAALPAPAAVPAKVLIPYGDQLRRLAGRAPRAVREHRHVGVLRSPIERRHTLLLSAISAGNYTRRRLSTKAQRHKGTKT
jgi:hypothetical protein